MGPPPPGPALFYLVDDEAGYLVGLISLLVGLVLALYGLFAGSPRPPAPGDR